MWENVCPTISPARFKGRMLEAGHARHFSCAVLILCCSTQLLAFNFARAPLFRAGKCIISSVTCPTRKSPIESASKLREATSILRMAEGSSSSGVDDENTVSETFDVEARAVSVEELKRELLVTMAGSNRGLSASRKETQTVLDIVSQLESLNPTQQPNQNIDMLCGKWRLLFTTAFDVLSLGTLPLIQTGQIFQNIKESERSPGLLTVDNVVNLQPSVDAILSALGGSSNLELLVSARGTMVGDDRIDITFESSKFQPTTFFGMEVDGVLPPLTIPLETSQGLQAVNTSMSTGFIKTSFLDADMRIARGGAPNGFYSENFKNNLFILWRED